MRMFALVVLAGCSFQPRAANHGSDAAGDDGPGRDAAASDGVIDTTTIDGATDTDGDGIPDSLDNCPTMPNADQRDHDVDGRGDVCDLCPHIAEPSDVDNDGDGVGDACDPRPTTAGDQRKLFVGFYDANDTVGWAAAGTWTVDLGKLTGGATNNGLLYTYPVTTYQHAFVQTAVHLNALATPTMMVSPAPQLFSGDGGNAQYYLCEAALQGASTKNAVAIDVYPNNQNHFDQQAFGGTLAAGSDLVLTDEVTGGTHTCIVSQGATKATVTQASGASTGVVALSAAYANVSYDYLWVVEIGQ